MKHPNLVLSLMGLCLLGLELGHATNAAELRPSVELTRQAVKLRVPPEVLDELWKYKKPVIVSEPNAQGEQVQTTYSLSPNQLNILINGESPEETLPQTTIRPSSSTTSTSTTVSPTTPATATATNPQTDWEYLPNALGNQPSFPTLGSNWPNFGANFPSSYPDWPSFSFPAGVSPEVSTNTQYDDQGRRVTTTTKTYRSPLFKNWATPGLPSNWPSFEVPAGATPEVFRKTETDPQGRTVTTTIRRYKTTSPVNWSTGLQPGVGTGIGTGIETRFAPGELPLSWQNRPSIFEGQLPGWSVPGSEDNKPVLQPIPIPTPQPLPVHPIQPLPVRPLQPLPTQWPSTRPTQRHPTRPTVLAPLPTDSNEAPLPTAPPKEVPTTTPLPSLEDFLKQSTPPNVVPINESDNGFVFRNGDGTRATSYSRTYTGATPPKTTELDPPLREILSQGGITDADIQDAQTRGEEVVRVRTLPDGRLIRTVVRVNTRPVAAPQPLPAAATPTAEGEQPALQDKSIDNFLSKVNLSPSDILSQNGEVVKTIVDKDGRVLSAKFVLSTVKGEEQGQGQSLQPTK
ncbi:hypothetical protein KR222_004246 [Zaprionus bogoriensis]|nr:hypothetical protein KR222_004246 [Zaprionus bogoriensis]